MVLSAAVALATQGSKFLNWGTWLLDWLQRFDYFAGGNTKSYAFLRWLFSPQSADLMFLIALAAFFVAVMLAISPKEKMATVGVVEVPVMPAAAAEEVRGRRHRNDPTDIGYLICDVMGEGTKRIRGAKITAENEHTGVTYSDHTDSQGTAHLRVPVGNYIVTVEAENHLPRTDGVRITTDVNEGHHHVTLQMVDAARREQIRQQVSSCIKQLAAFVTEGDKLLSGGRYVPLPNEKMKSDANDWERRTSDFIKYRLSAGETRSKMFLALAPIEAFEIGSATQQQRDYLNRLNTLLLRLRRMMNEMQSQLDDGMLF